MSATEVDNASGNAGVGKVDMKLEVQIIPVSDTDRSKAFYKRLGWRLDENVAPMDGLRIVQFTPASEVEARKGAEAAAAARLVEEGHLVRLWKPTAAHGETKALGLYRADSEAQLAGLLGALPLYDWMNVTVTPLESHPHDRYPRRPFPHPLGANNER
jgi:muconolactone D-isomerase